MNATTKTAKKAAKSGVILETSRHGEPLPTYYLVPSWVKGATDRQINAALFKLAASIEEASVDEPWVVQICRETACVYLELGTSRDSEAERGMIVLRSVERA